MKFNEFENIVSEERLYRYLTSCNGNKNKALTLYRYNIKIALDMFAIVGAFEIALRNSINKVMINNFGNNWLRDAILPGGIFDQPQCYAHAQIIRSAYEKLNRQGRYSHTSLLSKMEFGIWKYMFSSPQFRATNRILLKVFPKKPTSTREYQYNNTYIFNELDHINSLRNRIAHHEPICFYSGCATITTSYIEYIYNKILTLFKWLDIDSKSYLSGINNIDNTLINLNRLCKQ